MQLSQTQNNFYCMKGKKKPTSNTSRIRNNKHVNTKFHDILIVICLIVQEKNVRTNNPNDESNPFVVHLLFLCTKPEVTNENFNITVYFFFYIQIILKKNLIYYNINIWTFFKMQMKAFVLKIYFCIFEWIKQETEEG